MTALARRLAAEDSSNRGVDARLEPLDLETQGAMRPALWLLFGAVLFVLAIGCANVTSLELARAEARGGEIAVRAALGAGRARIAAQLLLESVVVSAAAGRSRRPARRSGGCRCSSRSMPPDVPRLRDVRVHGGILAFAVAVSFAVGVLSGLVPALSAARRRDARGLSAVGRGATGTRAARGARCACWSSAKRRSPCCSRRERCC